MGGLGAIREVTDLVDEQRRTPKVANNQGYGPDKAHKTPQG